MFERRRSFGCLWGTGIILLLTIQVPGGAQSSVSEDVPKSEARQEAPSPEDARAAEQRKRIEMNLLGAADTEGGESRRNENVHFNLVDNNALKELNVRLGVSATIVQEFRPDRSYFGAEFGTVPAAPPHVSPVLVNGLHGDAYWSHVNSVFSARSFFQVGDVLPARENEYGLHAGVNLWRGGSITVEDSQRKIRGQVNGNVLVPEAGERTPLTTDPQTRAIVQKYLDAYPKQLPNRTDIDPRMLNTNSPQVINADTAGVRLDQAAGTKDRFAAQYLFNDQNVNAFELVAGQNPEARVKSDKARLTWIRAWNARTAMSLTAGFDRLSTLLTPEPNSVGPLVSISGLESLGPGGTIPVRRAVNLYRYAGALRHTQGDHNWSAGFEVDRRQLNGIETDAHRGFFGFTSDFGHDAITNLRLGLPSQYIIAIGNVDRGFRNYEMQFYAGDTWRLSPSTTLTYSLRYEPVTVPSEVNNLNRMAYRSDWNNLAPSLGISHKLPRRWGILRAAAGIQYGEIFPVTYQQVRFSPPGSVKMVITAPDLVNPLATANASAKGNLYLLDPNLCTPYSYQYNFTWEPAINDTFHLQLGYVGSRSHKLLIMWYTNRAHPVPGIPQTTATINDRRPDPNYADIRRVLNGSQGYYDAARIGLVMRKKRGVSLDAAYWFSKAIDLGSSYTNTASDVDSRLARGQYEYNTRADMKGLSSFDQPNAFLARLSYETPGHHKPWGGWNFSGILLMKSGTPFTVVSGSDSPGYGNVDGNGGDRPNLLDPSILGRTIGNPDTSASLLPRSAFAYIQPTDNLGNLGRNTFRKGGIRNVNAALSRTWIVLPEKRLTFRAESINLTNTPQFADPGVELANNNFGKITNTLNDGRTFRLGLQFGW
jgi:hypothetical protein